jgi:hypothetical protein
MAIQNAPLATFNRGIVDQRALGRTDIKRIALSADTQTNWMPRILGSMTLRPGMQKIANTHGDKRAKYIPFVFSTSPDRVESGDLSLLEITASTMRVIIDDVVVTRPFNSTTIANGLFTDGIASWTDADETGAASVAVAGGYMGLTGTRFNAAIRRQEVAVAEANPQTGMVRATRPLLLSHEGRVTPPPGESVQPSGALGIPLHAMKIRVEFGPVTIKVGATAGDDDYFTTSLDTGVHSLAFYPKGNFFIQFENREEWQALVDSIEIESAGDLHIPTPWGDADLRTLRWQQSANIIFVASGNKQQYRIERRGTTSWSVVKYETEDGPFRSLNVSTATLTSDALSGEATVTASQDVFNRGHIGSIFQMRSVGQKVSASITGQGQFTDSIRVVGVGNTRVFDVDITGTWTATVTLQRSIDDEGSWTDVTTYTGNQNTTHNDQLDNVITFYRLGVDTGDFTSGTAVATLEWSGGGITGTFRVHTFTSATSIKAAILKRLGQTSATNEWNEGVWSDSRGWPTATTIYEGRLWWTGRDWIIGSVSDAFASFDEEIEGDSGPVIRTLGSGPVDKINWLLAMQRLIIGTEGSEVSARASAFDEPLSPDEFNIKEASTQGSADIPAIKVDSRGLFVNRALFRLIELDFDFSANDYQGSDLSLLAPEIGAPGFVAMAVQRNPDTRLHVPRSNGTVAVLVYDPAEEVRAWVEIETGDADGVNGVVEDVAVLPGTEEDAVYYQVLRVINGVKRRFLEKWAKESDSVGGTLSKMADSFVHFRQAASATISGLDHLEGEAVVVWADGKCLDDASGNIATFTVSNGSITATDGGSSTTVSEGIVGLPYTGTFKSGTLPYAANLGTELGQRQRITNIALLLYKTHHRGITFGPDVSNLDPLPQVVQGATVADDTVHSFLTQEAVTFPGNTVVDARLVLRGHAPRPVTVVAAVLSLATIEHQP